MIIYFNIIIIFCSFALIVLIYTTSYQNKTVNKKINRFFFQNLLFDQIQKVVQFVPFQYLGVLVRVTKRCQYNNTEPF